MDMEYFISAGRIYILEGLEWLWIEVINSRRQISLSLFYKEHNSEANYYNTIEDYVVLAVDTGIKDIIINLNCLNNTFRQKIDSLSMQFSLNRSISQPIHFTEHSSRLKDIILVSNKENPILSGVADPFRNQDIEDIT